MHASSADGVTVLLRAWGNGDGEALKRVTPIIYNRLHRIARSYMAREKTGHLLQTTALVNELYLQLAGMGEVDWQDRNHFFTVCAQLMRHILTDHARSNLTLKGGGGTQRVPLDEALLRMSDPHMDLVALDVALDRLAEFDPRKSQVVQLRFFVGLSIEETAIVLNVSARTVKRDWTLAKMWLLRELNRGGLSRDGLNRGDLSLGKPDAR
jgi:RNA polymerase sigma factor (TIGR02999 family)